MVRGGVDGKIKFFLEWTKTPPIDLGPFEELRSWRRRLYSERLIGCEGGIGYGNVSQRIEGLNGFASFVITGSRTGHLEELDGGHYNIVVSCHPRENRVVCRGPIEASSESMTHGIIYELDKTARFVFHAHTPTIWNERRRLQLPTTDEKVEYGTPEMADEVVRLFRETNVSLLKMLAMGGHINGVISFGSTANEAGETMIEYLRKAREAK